MGNIFNHARRGMAKSNTIETEHFAFFSCIFKAAAVDF